MCVVPHFKNISFHLNFPSSQFFILYILVMVYFYFPLQNEINFSYWGIHCGQGNWFKHSSEESTLYQWPQKRTSVLQKLFKKKKKTFLQLTYLFPCLYRFLLPNRCWTHWTDRNRGSSPTPRNVARRGDTQHCDLTVQKTQRVIKQSERWSCFTDAVTMMYIVRNNSITSQWLNKSQWVNLS